MVIYKVNIEVKKEEADRWFGWMTTKHIPDVINTNHFYDFTFSRLVPNGIVASEGYVKFQIQYFCRNMEEYELYKKENAPALQKEHEEKFQGLFMSQREIYEDLTREMVEMVENNNPI